MRAWQSVRVRLIAMAGLMVLVVATGLTPAANASRKLGDGAIGQLLVKAPVAFGPWARVPNTGGNIVAGSGDGIAGEFHVVYADGTGAIFHILRRADGSWSAPLNIAAVAGDPGDVVAVSATNVAQELHVLMATDGGAIFHTIRHADGGWQHIGNVAGAAGDPGDVDDVAGADVNNELHVVMATDSGAVFHTIRHSSGWDHIGNVGSVAGDPGDVRAVTATGVGGEFYLTEVTSDNKAWFTIRHSNGWDQVRNVRTLASGLTGILHSAASTGIRSEYHLVVNGPGPDAVPHVSYTIRRSDGTWTPFNDVASTLGTTSTVFSVGGGSVSRTMNLVAVVRP